MPVNDTVGNPIIRVKIDVDSKISSIDARILAKELANANIPIITRFHHADEGNLKLEMRFLDDVDIDYICSEIKKILNKSQDEKAKLLKKYEYIKYG